MRRSVWTRVLAMFLVVTMLASPVSAFGWGGKGSGRGGFFGSIWDKWFGGSEEVTEPTEPADSEEAVLTLVEDASTVENGELLRASTYTLTTADEDSSAANTASVNAYSVSAAADDTDAAADATTVKYFPVTMYDYDQSIINAATDALDDALTVREGFYFSGGSPEYTKEATTDWSAFVAGQYYIQNIRAAENGVGSWLYSVADDTSIRGTANREDATLWTLVVEDGSYYLMSGGKYLVVGTDGNSDGLTETKTAITLSTFSGNSNGVQLSQNGYYLCQWGSNDSIYYGGYHVNDDGGNGMLFYAVDSEGSVSSTPTVPTSKSIITSGYEAWNRWDKASGTNANGDLIYTGLVQNTLIDDEIVFTVNEGGVFDDNTAVKDIYEYVGLPFVLKEDGVYSFDSDENGVYFADTNGDRIADPKSGTEDAPYNLYFDEGSTQPLNIVVGDGSTNAWFPYNLYTTGSNGNKTYNEDINYHFGMRADLPFSMTPNGRINSTDDTSTPITFSFSGDDDVWVFIDGHLVIDLGGIHNRLDVTIDFAANTITYSEENNQDTNTSTGSYNNPEFSMIQKLFTDSEGTGVINMSRDAFAADVDHEMQVFYLERGEGTSNCKIEFNLPMNDTVIVTKDATKSWSQPDEGSGDDGVDSLTNAEQAIVNNIDFGFTLYKRTADSDTFSPVANTNFYLIGRGVTGTVINQTDANGHFYLKNGQSAKFITEIPADGVTYYVVEDKTPDGFLTPDYTFDGESTHGFDYYDSTLENPTTTHVATADLIPEQELDLDASENRSYVVTAMGSVEANDSIEFICSNFLDAELPNPTALAYEDMIVIDYGLPVQIDPLANDVFRGDSVEIIAFGGADMTMAEPVDKDGNKVFEEDELDITNDDTYDFGTVELNDVTYSAAEDGTITRDTFTYTLNKQLTEVEVLTYIIKVTGKDKQEATQEELTQYDYAIGKIYIVPATVMYYEENFSGLVTFTGSNWKGKVTTAGHSDYQEPGVVGTVGDSTYGSDAAYLSDSNDSNGTSYYGDTTAGAIKFTYTFTGTGTSFFARTSAKTGYMQVKLYEGEGTSGELINLTYRDTYYEDTNGSDEDLAGTLYNIPVYTESNLDYGTYTVVVTVAKAGTAAAGGDNGSGNEFYLDGIRIMQPLCKYDADGNVVSYEDEDTVYNDLTTKALGAYATDGEANMEVITLRQKLITDNEPDYDSETGDEAAWPFVVLTDTNGQIVYASDYVSFGPKEEVYLLPGQSVSFSIKHWHTDGYLLHMGMKAPFGNAAVKVGQTTYNLANAADCYYEVTGNYSSVVTEYDEAGNPYYVATYTFTATDSIVALTNIKVTGNYEFVLIEDTDIDVEGGEA